MMNIAQEQDLLKTLTTSLPKAQRIAVFAPHPDDEVFGCGGTIYRLVQGGAKVQIHIVTDGALGGQPSSSDIIAQRQEESCSAVAILGQLPPLFWKLPDRSLRFCEALVSRVQETLEDDPVDLLFAPAPSEIHPDHQALGLACAEAVRRLGGSLQVAFYEIGAPLARANLLIDISAVEEIKAQAMECFVTQLADQPYVSRIRGLNQFRGHLLGPEVRAAEAFLLVSAAELSRGLQPLFEGPLILRRHLGYVADLTDQPLISVIVRSMDRPYLDEALSSLSLQLYPNIEVIVVNARGGEHRRLANACAGYPLRLVNQNGSPLGRSSAANVGLKACRGEFISFLDDDDVILPDHLHGLLQAACQQPKSVAVYAETSGMRRNDPGGTVLVNFVETEITFTKLLLGNVLPIHSVLFPASVLSSGVAFDETLDLYEDWDFWLQLLLQIPFVSVAQQTAIYYLGGDSGISPLDPDPKQVCQAVARLYAKWREWITPETLVQVRQLYHDHSEAFVRRESELSRQLHQRSLKYEETDRELHQRQLELADKDAQLHQRQLELADKDAQLHQCHLRLEEYDQQLHQRNLELIASQQQLQGQKTELQALKEELQAIRQSRFYQLYARLTRISTGAGD